MEDRERVRLREANYLVSEVKGKGIESDFLSLARRLPTLLANNGLLVTVAYLQRRGKEGEGEKPETLMLNFIVKWLKSNRLKNREIKESLLEVLLSLDPQELALIFDEVLRVAEAVKIVAEARLERSG
ncbi:MAG: type III-B CRISPR module-associated protein Cmr5 [Candidatus Korarchaeum sp.]|nr:type III-B CRISPR module-associated protein Cmr5 [Candidatus Korarchaeum sp.]